MVRCVVCFAAESMRHVEVNAQERDRGRERERERTKKLGS